MNDREKMWPNGCDKTVPAALRFLADNPRPYAGEAPYNAAHLHQLASEIERAAALLTEPTLEEVLAELEQYGDVALRCHTVYWTCSVHGVKRWFRSGAHDTPLQAARECLRRVKE